MQMKFSSNIFLNVLYFNEMADACQCMMMTAILIGAIGCPSYNWSQVFEHVITYGQIIHPLIF